MLNHFHNTIFVERGCSLKLITVGKDYVPKKLCLRVFSGLRLPSGRILGRRTILIIPPILGFLFYSSADSYIAFLV